MCLRGQAELATLDKAESYLAESVAVCKRALEVRDAWLRIPSPLAASALPRLS